VSSDWIEFKHPSSNQISEKEQNKMLARVFSFHYVSLFSLGWTMLACLTCSFFVDYPPSIEPYLFETPSPFKRRTDCFVSVPPESPDCTSPTKSTDTVVMDLLKRFKRTVKDQSHPSRTNKSKNDQSLGGRGQWNYPARLYYPIGDTRDSDSSDNSDCSDISSGTGAKDTSSIDSRNHDADDEASVQSFEALQFEASASASIQSSILVGELAFENMSMVYSEDDENSTTSSAVSNISALSSHLSLDGMMEHTSTGVVKNNTAKPTPTPNKSSSSSAAAPNVNANANSNTSCLNMLQLQDRHESDDESLLSEASSIFFSPDTYFQPQEEEANEVTDNDSNEEETSDNYIFTDDKSDPPSPPIERLSVAESAALARLCSRQQLDQEEEEKKEADHGDFMSPTTWSHCNSGRGSKTAKALQKNLGDNTVTAEDEDEAMQMPHSSPYHRRLSSRRTGSTEKCTSSMLGRAVQSLRRKRYTPSSSPLDFQHPPKANKQEDVATSKSLLLSSLSSSQKPVALPDPAMSSSAVYARNALVDFSSWEARVSRPAITTPSAAATTATPTTCPAAEAKRAPLSVQLPEEEGQNSVAEPCTGVTPTGVKVTSLLTSGMTSNIPPLVSRQNDELDTSALESPRTLGDDMLQSLGLDGDDHARQCLQTLRSRAGVIDDLDCLDQQGADEDPSNILPWMHIVDDVWMPHYEEYVFTTVHAFHRRLLGPSV
jgi:hypothetical protein